MNANYIARIKQKNGEWLENGDAIKEFVANFFATFFGYENAM